MLHQTTPAEIQHTNNATYQFTNITQYTIKHTKNKDTKGIKNIYNKSENFIRSYSLLRTTYFYL